MKKHIKPVKKLFFDPTLPADEIVNGVKSAYTFHPPTYYELNGRVAKTEPTEDGGMRVTVPEGVSMADFFLHGTKITKEEYEQILKKTR